MNQTVKDTHPVWIVPCGKDGAITEQALENTLKKATKTTGKKPSAMIINHCSNVTGYIQDMKMAADFAECKEHIVPAHPFSDDIISVSRKLAERFCCDTEHIHQVEIAALKLFDALRKANHLTKKDRLLLQIAAILHNCGSFFNLNDIGENSYKIVTSTEIIGLSHQERMIVAYVIRYTTGDFPEYSEIKNEFSREEYIKIAKLNAILCLADAMDRSHQQKFTNFTVRKRGYDLTITGQTLYDITLEHGMFIQKSPFFEEAFGIRPVLRQKKCL